MADKKKKKGGGSSGKLFVLLLVIVGAGAGYVNFQEDTYEVTKSIVITEEADDVWEFVGDFKKWPEWGPWAAADPSMKWTHAESSTVVGDTMGWTGKDGDGSMEWTKIEEDKLAVYKFKFKDYPEATGSFYLKEDEEDNTTVTWTFKGHKGGFFGKAFFLTKDTEKDLGSMFNKGLEKLKTKVEE